MIGALDTKKYCIEGAADACYATMVNTEKVGEIAKEIRVFISFFYDLGVFKFLEYSSLFLFFIFFMWGCILFLFFLFFFFLIWGCILFYVLEY